jgi:signal transduction histidine kinase
MDSSVTRPGRPRPAAPGEKWAATARQALLYALPLAFVALLAAQWLDADFVMLRESAQKQSAQMAEALGEAGARVVTDQGAIAWADIARAEADPENSASRLWQVVYGYNLNLLILQRKGERTVFPPEDPLAMPKMWEEKLRALSDLADLLRDGDLLNGWFPHVSGEYYFECRRDGDGAARNENCIALSSKLIFPSLFAALDVKAEGLPNWSFRLRDPFDRVVWRHGASTASFQSFMLGGALHNWAVEIAGAPPPRRGALGRLALAAPLALFWLLLVFQARRAQNALLAEVSARAALATRLSHDLRTPLANLKLYAELISRKASGPEVDRYCAVLTEEVDRLDVLAGETIFENDAFSRFEPRKSAADPGRLAQNILARYEKLLGASGSRAELHCAVDKILRFDASAFERILINLVDNARKYAPGRICVTIDWRDGMLSMAVRDFGGGAAKPSPDVSLGVSQGLGLAIVGELTRANGGAFTLSGADPGLRASATIRAEPASSESEREGA